jgi:ribosomal protein S18 acetylase RimI-like enzyme
MTEKGMRKADDIDPYMLHSLLEAYAALSLAHGGMYGILALLSTDSFTHETELSDFARRFIGRRRIPRHHLRDHMFQMENAGLVMSQTGESGIEYVCTEVGKEFLQATDDLVDKFSEKLSEVKFLRVARDFRSQGYEERASALEDAAEVLRKRPS